MAKSPKGVSIRTYNVGFGDCFLLSFDYGGAERHVLIDFGSTGFPPGVPKDRMMQIANDIRERTKRKLHAVVATHRHKDHISGFATKGGKGTGDIIAALEPNIVVQPWTEDPDLKPDATGLRAKKKQIARKLGRMGATTPKHIAALTHMHGIARQMLAARNLPRAFKGELSFLGETNLANKSAIDNLMTMGKKRSYVYCGSKSGLEQVLPGVRVHVLGPPTVDQTDKIKKQRSSDPDEFWQFQARSIGADEAISGGEAALFPRHVETRGARFPIRARWLRYHSRTMRGEQLLQIVRMLDQQMNNTSVILVFQVRKKCLLFPGDAQIENWAYALGQDKYKALLAGVDLYKVGHHGSRNATPKTLWNSFKKRSKTKKPARLKSLMSTMADKHGHGDSKTEVPRSSLVNALQGETEFLTTQAFKEELYRDTRLAF
jgi:hypothetical protein